MWGCWQCEERIFQLRAYCGTILYDAAIIYLAFSEQLLEIEELGIHVTDDGYTRIDKHAPKIRCATMWRDLEAFDDLLVERLIG